jgi:Bacterial PH domain
MGIMTEGRKQIVSGLIPPQVGEAMVRQAFPSVAATPAIASLGLMLTRTFVLAPLGWLIMAGPYFAKLLPIFACRYTLTNRRLMIRRGWNAAVAQEVPLEKIDDVRIVEDANSPFFRAATLEIISGGQVVMRLPGVPGPEAYRHAIINVCRAWAPKPVAAPAVVAPAAASPASAS